MKSSHYITRNLIKILMVLLLILVLFLVGLVIGYSVIGEGKSSEVFNSRTWIHILDFFKK